MKTEFEMQLQSDRSGRMSVKQHIAEFLIAEGKRLDSYYKQMKQCTHSPQAREAKQSTTELHIQCNCNCMYPTSRLSPGLRVIINGMKRGTATKR